MSQNRWRSIFIPKRFLLRLTIINIIVIVAFVMLSSWAIYNTACMLADGLFSMSLQKQNQFEAMLFQYLWIFSISAVILGSLIHFYLMKKVMQPLKKLIYSTKKMKQGQYPSPIQVKENGEIGELVCHFNDLAQQLATNEQQRKKLVSDLSHEFRTPLTNLNGYLGALQSGMIEGDEKLYQSLYAESTKLTQLVEQMEQLKEWENMKNRTFDNKVPVDMKEFIEKSIEIFHWSLEQKGIELEVDIHSGIVDIDQTSISQVLSNLLDNAIRYYEGSNAIIVRGEKLPAEYRVSVTGLGRDLSEIDKEKIFERFYRTEPSRSRELGGSGLGLAISKEIIERHKGKIGVQSKGNIHTFWFILPYT
ncbi:sensor histidine kinase [Amphibacillus sp. Q70]|uniref:sensor histidine kinase n=1 Tax=Amphibacillus sp. Q70 TaxID=3453416 RepID=UPI003F85230E